MPIEQRVISGPKIGAGKIGGGAAPATAAESEAAPTKRKMKVRRPVLVVVLVVLLAAAGAAYWFLGRGGDDAPKAEPAPQPGAVVTVEPVSLNLADGHYLRLGFGMQLTKGTAEAPDTARALDLAIALYSGRTVAEITDPATRDALKAQFVQQLAEAYDGEVMDVYLTNFVTQ